MYCKGVVKMEKVLWKSKLVERGAIRPAASKPISLEQLGQLRQHLSPFVFFQCNVGVDRQPMAHDDKRTTTGDAVGVEGTHRRENAKTLLDELIIERLL